MFTYKVCFCILVLGANNYTVSQTNRVEGGRVRVGGIDIHHPARACD